MLSLPCLIHTTISDGMVRRIQEFQEFKVCFGSGGNKRDQPRCREPPDIKTNLYMLVMYKEGENVTRSAMPIELTLKR